MIKQKETPNFLQKRRLLNNTLPILLFLLAILNNYNSYAQKTKKDIHNLKQVLRVTDDKKTKIKTIYKILHHEYKKDTVLLYANQGIALSKDYNNDWLAKFYIFKAKCFPYKKLDSIYKYYQQALSLTNDPEIKAKVYIALAGFYLNRKRVDSTKLYIEKFFDLKPQNPRVLALGLHIKGSLYKQKGNYQKAIEYNEKAIAWNIKHKITANTYAYYHDLAKIRYTLRQYDLAIKALEEALLLSNKNTYEYGQTLAMMSTMTASLRPKDTSSITYMKKALAAFIKDDCEYFIIATGYKNLASRYLDYNKNDEALVNLKKFKEYTQKTTDKSYYHPIYMVKMGHYFNNINSLDSADIYLTKSLSLIKKNKRLKSYEKGTIFQMALLLKKQNKTDEAKKTFLQITEKGGTTYVTESYANLYKINEEQKNYKKALYYHLKYTELQDNIKKGEKENVLAELLVKYDTREKENNLLKAALENKNKDVILAKQKKNYTIITMIITSLIFLLFLLFLYYKSKKELRLELELKNVKETTKLKNRFIESLSQDIKTPITIINGYLDLIEKNSIHPAEVVNWTKIGQKNTELLMNKFNSFLSLIKLDEKQKLNESVKTESISKYIEEITNTFSYLASTKNIGLYFKSNTTDDLKVSYNYERIEKILNNLITNAIKFTDSKNNIFIEIKIDKTSLSIIVKDEGIGIAKDEQKLIFDRFYQSKKNKTIGGFGIGLSLVKELTNSLNGMIELDSKEDIGSIFKVNIPLEPIENIDLYLNPLPPEYNELSKIVKTLTTCNNKFPKILIVEESLEMIAYLKDLLGNFLECHIAHNGREALLQIKEVDFNLIISEYAIPIINGKELKIELNKNEEYEKIPFIMLTAASVKNFTDIKLSLGINDYIVKPFSSNELITRIRGALENNIMLIKIQNNEDKVEFDSHVTQLLDKINIFVLVNISDTNYNVGDLASDCGYGQKQFGKIIKDKTGMSPVNLILEIRLLKAYELLLNKKYATIMEIIYAVGLTNRSYFNKAFTTRFGIKPKELTTKLISF